MTEWRVKAKQLFTNSNEIIKFVEEFGEIIAEEFINIDECPYRDECISSAGQDYYDARMDAYD